MAIRRACSYKASIRTPQPPVSYLDMLVTVAQNGVNVINKPKDTLLIDADTVTLQLTQEETAQFEAGVPAQIQIRCFAEVYDAPGSAVFTVDVLPALNDTILGGS